jgi:hypothetical protein
MFGFPTGQSVVFLFSSITPTGCGKWSRSINVEEQGKQLLAEAVRREMLDLHSSPIANNSLHVDAIHNPRDFRNFEHS